MNSLESMSGGKILLDLEEEESQIVFFTFTSKKCRDYAQREGRRFKRRVS